jgi:hypothetical protein
MDTNGRVSATESDVNAMKSERAEGLEQMPTGCQHTAARYTVRALRASVAAQQRKEGYCTWPGEGETRRWSVGLLRACSVKERCVVPLPGD